MENNNEIENFDDRADRAGQNRVAINAFSNLDIQKFYRLFQRGRVELSPIRPHLTRFTAIEEFILESRRTARLLVDVNGLDLDDLDNDSTKLMRTWLTEVVPSCVYRYRSPQYGQTLFFSCCFSDCKTPVSSQSALIRHYREQHFERMPAGIFGELVRYFCRVCGMHFKRQQHLNQHFATITHITKMAISGSDTSKKHLEALENSRRFAEHIQVSNRANRLSLEENYYNAPSAGATLAIASVPYNRSPTPNEPQINQTEQTTLHQNRDREDDTDDELSQKTLSQLSIQGNVIELDKQDPVPEQSVERADTSKRMSRDNDERLLTMKENQKVHSIRKRRHERSETSDDEIEQLDFEQFDPSTYRFKKNQPLTIIGASAQKKPQQTKRRKQNLPENDFDCIKCFRSVRWQVCTGSYNRDNAGRVYYKCSNCEWFQWRDKL